MITPLADKVLVVCSDECDRTEGGLYLTQPQNSTMQKGIVYKISEFLENCPLKENDKVLFMSVLATDIEHKGSKYKLLSAKDILIKID